MTERERVSATYAKVNKKYPVETNEETKKQLCIKLEQRRTLWLSVVFFWLGILCLAIGFLTEGSIAGFGSVFYVVAAFEYFRTCLNASKIRVHYGKIQGKTKKEMLTGERLMRDIQKARSNNGREFRLVKALLYDKEDRDESSVSFIFHKYTLYFQLAEETGASSLRVSRRTYLKAPLDAPYVLALSPSGTVLAAYMDEEWMLSDELFGKCAFDATAHNNAHLVITPQQAAGDPLKNDVLWDMLLLISQGAALFVPMVIAAVWLPIAVFFSTKRTVEHKNVLSVINCAAGFFLLSWLTALLLAL